MASSHLVGIACALASALVWGGGDFSGGLATRRSHQLHVLVLSIASGIGLLLVGAVVAGEAFPAWPGVLWAALAGLSGMLGLSMLYRGLALGQAASVAPTAAVISAALPVVFSGITEGLPGLARLVGLLLALFGIGLVSMSTSPAPTGKSATPLALFAGLGFGGFFILIAQVEDGVLFTPLIVARSVALVSALVLLWWQRVPLPGIRHNSVALLAGLLDAGGNILYLLAKQFTRLDVAAVLSSLYPATTVLLAWLLLKEQVSGRQWLGAAVCLLAVALIAL